MTIVCVSRRASAVVAVLTTGTVRGTSPIFPTQVMEETTSVSFEIKTLWHSIRAKLEGFSGVASLNDSSDATTVHGRIVFPLDRIRTDSGLTNRKLASLCDVKNHPRARYSILGLSGIQELEQLGIGESAPVKLVGVLTIRAISQLVPVVGTIKRTPRQFCFSGDASFDWREFGIVRPRGYVFFGVSPTVSVHVETVLHAGETGSILRRLLPAH